MLQLILPFRLPESFSEDTFFISASNEQAYMTVLNKENWQAHTLYLYGEKYSGKTHLADIWRKNNDAVVIDALSIKPQEISGNCSVEDIENCNDPEALLHLFNHCKDINAQLLMTSAVMPAALKFTLPDLTSRLRGAQLAIIYPPDDEIITSVMRKQFSDRQLLVDDEVITYLGARIERSFEGVKTLVELIDKNSMTEQKNITIPFVRKLLG